MEFLKLWEILLRRKWIILAVFVLFMSVVIVVTKSVRSVYKAEALVLIDSSDSLSSLLSALGLSTKGTTATTSTDDAYDTDIALTQIKPVLNDLIKTMNLKDRKGKAIKPDKLVTWNLMNTTIMPQPYINIDQYNDADMLTITAYSTDPVQAADMANRLANLTIQDRTNRTKAEYKAARLFIESKVSDIEREYDASLKELKNYKIKEKTVDISLETQNLLNKISSLKNEYEDNDKTIAELGNKVTEAESKLAKMDILRKESEELQQNQIITALKTKMNEFLLNISQKSIDITTEHPDYKELEKEVETVKNLMKTEANLVLNSERFGVDPVYDNLSKVFIDSYINKGAAIAKKKIMSVYLDSYQRDLLNIPAKYSELSRLDLALSVKKDVYKSLLEYMTQVEVAESMTLSNIKLVEPAEVPEKNEVSFPKKTINVILGAFMGLFWGLAIAFFIEYIDNTLKTPDDLKHIKDLPLLGFIPQSKEMKKNLTIASLDVNSPMVEAYRTIKNSIRYASVDKPIKCLALSSLIPGEGKSSTASNLALNFCSDDKKVIIIDLDLRRPSLHKIFKVRNDKGITNLIAEGGSLDDVIVSTGIKGLDLLPSGPIPPTPSKLVESKKVAQIVNALKERYDIVIIDTPPFLAVNDAFAIAAVSDGLVYVIEAGRVTFSMVENAKTRFDQAGINLIGVVFNKLKIHSSGYYNYKYYYSHYNPK